MDIYSLIASGKKLAVPKINAHRVNGRGLTRPRILFPMMVIKTAENVAMKRNKFPRNDPLLPDVRNGSMTIIMIPAVPMVIPRSFRKEKLSWRKKSAMR